MVIKTVIFDIDDTMYDYTRGNLKGLEAVKSYCHLHLGIDGPVFHKALGEACRIMEKKLGLNQAAVHNRLLRYQCMLELLGQPVFPHGANLCSVYWETLMEDMEPEPGLLKPLKALKERGVSIGVGTNMTAWIQFKKLERLNITSYLDWLVTSEEAGVEKPTPRFYRYCAEKAGCEAGECLFIGDSQKGDVIGPIEFGMHGLWYHPGRCRKEEKKGEYPAIQSFEECLSESFWKEIVQQA